jgi:hypothetical protein
MAVDPQIWPPASGPGSGDATAANQTTIIAGHAVPTADVTTNTLMRDVIGNKTDAAVVTDVADKSIAGKVRGILSLIINGTYGLSAIRTLVAAIQTTIGTPLTAGDITAADSLAMANLTGNSNARVVTKTITGTHPTGWITDTTAMFNGAGAVQILAIVCKVTTAVENAATTLKIQAVVDSLAAVDICAATTITNFAVKSVLAVTGTFADVMSGAGATAVGVLALNPSPIIISSTTSFTLNYLFSAASDGAIKFDILWIPLNAAGSITAA